ncbi:MAG: redoxin domain-containing protein [Actinomycetota bacterium]|nr:redoxin domain-containing protein [Actinomycetota bacterium]
MRVRTQAAILLVVSSLVGTACGRGSGEASRTSTSDRPIAIGAVAPRFTLPAARGGDVSLDDFLGKQPVLLYFSMGPG